MSWEIKQGNCLDLLRSLPDQHVQMVCTSPPYWGLRDYNVEGQIGLERTPAEFVEKMVVIFREVRRVLKDDGTLWLNLGDSYASFRDSKSMPDTLRGPQAGTMVPNSNNRNITNLREAGLKHKDLCGIPWRVAFALQADGWYLRSDIVWAKPNPMPESVKDRPTKSHEYIFLLTKSERYYYDAEAIREDATGMEIANTFRGACYVNGSIDNSSGGKRTVSGNKPPAVPSGGDTGPGSHHGLTGRYKTSGNLERKQRPGAPEGNGKRQAGSVPWTGATRNKRSVWEIGTKPFAEAHFATFPEELPLTCIAAGSKEGDLILDPFNGAATTGVAALNLNREYLGLELNAEYIEISKKRIESRVGLLLDHVEPEPAPAEQPELL